MGGFWGWSGNLLQSKFSKLVYTKHTKKEWAMLISWVGSVSSVFWIVPATLYSLLFLILFLAQIGLSLLYMIYAIEEMK